MFFFKGAGLVVVCVLMTGCASSSEDAKTPGVDIGQLASDIAEKGDDDTALAVYMRAAELSPRDPAVWVSIGNIYMRQKRYDDAIEAYLRGKEVAPRSIQVLVGLGSAYLMSGKAAEGRHALALAETSAASASDYNRLGVALTQAGMFSEAIAFYERALARTPNDVDIQVNLALASAISGQSDKAVKIMSSVLASPSVQDRHRANYALALATMGREDEARSVLPKTMAKEDVQSILHSAKMIRNAQGAQAKGRILSTIFVS